jgi:hypothetical protein
MRLLLNGQSISIRQMGPDFLLIDPTNDHCACDARIRTSIDGNEREWKVRLPKGIAKNSTRVELATAG